MVATFDDIASPLPDITDRELAGYWAGTAAGELRVQLCRSCGEYRWPPRSACSNCQSFDAEWVAVATEGELFTWTVVATTTVAGFKDVVPYAVGVVQLDGVPIRMLGYLEEEPDTLVAGERLQARFVTKAEGVTLPVWHRGTSTDDGVEVSAR